jgi:putative serine protease PepD
MKRTAVIGLVAAATVAGSGLAVAVADNTAGSATGTIRTVTVTAPASGQDAAATDGQSISQVAAAAAPGVVEIQATGSSSEPTPFGPQEQSAQGTGFEIDSNGNIVTNAHVVAGASSISVKTQDGKTYKATVVGTDETTDVAVVHIDAPSSALHPLAFADSNSVVVGQTVVAIGNPFGLEDTVTAGIVSALHRTITSPNNRPITNAIQTDAAINHGNSGGPLLDTSGRVIGITSQIYSDGQTSGNVGIGFAVPSDTVRTIVGELLANGKAVHPVIGIYLEPAAGGVRITRVKAGSPGEQAGLKTGDVVTAFDGHAVSTPDQIIAAVNALKPGDHVKLTITRSGGSQTVDVTLGSG